MIWLHTYNIVGLDKLEELESISTLLTAKAIGTKLEQVRGTGQERAISQLKCN